MMKKLCALLLALLLCLSLSVSVFAASDFQLIDGADLLSLEEEEELYGKLRELSEEYDIPVSVVTVSDVAVDEDDFDDYAQDYYGEYDGILLLVCMDPRQYRILVDRDADEAISDSALDEIESEIQPELSDGDYAEAFETFAEQCEYYLDGYEYGFPFDFGKNLLGSVVIGLVIGVVVAFCLKAQLKSVRRQYQADVYVRANSMHITQATDLFLYRNVTRRERPQNNSSSRSGGRKMGGGSF